MPYPVYRHWFGTDGPGSTVTDGPGSTVMVVRASAREPRYDGELLSSGAIVERILAERD